MGLTGRHHLADAKEKVRKLNGAVPRAAKLARSKIDRVVKREFRLAKDPYGTPWAPLARSNRQPLKGTGKMRRSLSVTVQGNVLRLKLPHPAQYHQHGTPKMPARPIFPAPGTELPPDYVRALVDAAEAAAKMKGSSKGGRKR
jgi:hypothetical protein